MPFKIFLLFCFLYSTTTVSFAETYEELYERVFKKKVEIPVFSLTVQLIIDNTSLNSIRIRIDEQHHLITFHFDAVKTDLQTHLIPSQFEKIKSQVDSEGNLSNQTLHALGFKTHFNRENFTFEIRTPPELQPIIKINLQNTAPPRNALDTKATWSGFINYKLEQRLFNAETNPLILDQAGVLFHSDWILKTRYRNLAIGNSGGTLTELSWLKTMPTTMQELSIGDYFAQTIGFQSASYLTGVQLSRQIDTKTYHHRFPKKSDIILIQNPSTVTIYINDKNIRELKLAPGRYELMHFPLQFGHNAIRIHIKENEKTTQTLNYSIIEDPRLLLPGFTDFSYSIGWASTIRSTFFKEYPSTPAILSTYQRYGISDSFSGGWYSQVRGTQGVVGLDCQLGSTLGLIQLRVAGSRSSLAKIGNAWQLSFSNYVNTAFLRNWGIHIQNRSNQFMSATQTLPRTNSDTRLSLHSAFKPSPELLCNLQYFQQHQNHGINLTLAYKLNNLSMIRSEWEWRQQINQSEFRIQVHYAFADDAKENRYEYHQTMSHQDKSLTWSYSPKQTDSFSTRTKFYQISDEIGIMGHINTQLDQTLIESTGLISQELNTQQSQIAVAIQNPRAIMDLRYFRDHNQSTLYENGSIQLESSVVYADGHTAISKPIHHNFVLIYPHPDLQQYSVLVNPDSNIDPVWGPAVIADLPEKTTRYISLDPINIPLGSAFDQKLFEVTPDYFGGNIIRFGSGKKLILSAQLVSTEQTPLALRTGKLVSLDEKTAKEFRFFTNRSGQFQIMGISEGRYQLIILNAPYQETILKIPPTESGFLNFGEIVLKPQATPLKTLSSP